MELKIKTQFNITPVSPFHFDGTFKKPSHFPDKLSDWESGKYWQTIRIWKKIFAVKIEDFGTLTKPELKVSVFYNNKTSDAEIAEIRGELIWRYELNRDLK